jgi:hypothetical protein
MLMPQQQDPCHFVISYPDDFRGHADIMYRFSDLTRMCSRNSRSVSCSCHIIHLLSSTGLPISVIEFGKVKINRARALRLSDSI